MGNPSLTRMLESTASNPKIRRYSCPGCSAQLLFEPNALVRLARQEGVSGVYLPFWTFDAHTLSHYTGERGEYYWETETYHGRDDLLILLSQQQ